MAFQRLFTAKYEISRLKTSKKNFFDEVAELENRDDFEVMWRYPSKRTDQEYDFISSLYGSDYYKPKLCKRFLPSLAINNAIVESWSKNNYKTIDVSLDSINYHSRKIGIEYKYRMDLGDIKPDSPVLSYKLSKEERFKKLFRNNKCKEYLKSIINNADRPGASGQVNYINFLNQHPYPARVNTCEKLRKMYNLPANHSDELKPLRKASIASDISQGSELSWHLDEFFKSDTLVRNDQAKAAIKKSTIKAEDEDKEKLVKKQQQSQQQLEQTILSIKKRFKKRKHQRKHIEIEKIVNDLSDPEGAENEAEKSAKTEFKPFFFKKPKYPRLKMSKIVSNTKIENEYTKTISKDEKEVNYKFLILNKNNKMLVFCSPVAMKVLDASDQWQASGRFHIKHKHYYQMYIIEAFFMGRMVPCVYALMHRHRQRDFNLLFSCIKRENRKVHKTNLSEPRMILCDFQKGAVNSLRKNFPSSTLRGCILAFGRSIFTGLKKLRLTPFYATDPDLKRFFLKVYWLCLIPSELVEEQYKGNWEHKPSLHGITEFCDSFQENYINGSFPKGFPMEFWNRCGDLDFTIIKSNVLSNERLCRHVSSEYIDIQKIIKIFQREELHVDHLYRRYICGEGTMAVDRNNEFCRKLDELNNLQRSFENKYYTYDGYYELLQDLELYKPEYNTSKTISESTDEATDTANDDSPDSDTPEAQTKTKTNKVLKKGKSQLSRSS